MAAVTIGIDPREASHTATAIDTTEKVLAQVGASLPHPARELAVRPAADDATKERRQSRHSVSRPSAAAAKATMFADRSSEPVSRCRVESAVPVTATQTCPGGSPYRLPDGPAAPLSPIAHVVSSLAAEAWARYRANSSVSPRKPGGTATAPARKAWLATRV